MNTKIVDARGELCPKPLIMTKKALKQNDGSFTVLLDNDVAFQNVQRFLMDNEVAYHSDETNGEFQVAVAMNGTMDLLKPQAEEYCVVSEDKSAIKNVICFKSDRMGDGPEELGEILIQAFCNTIKEVEPLPSKIICYNSGVKLIANDSPVLASLKELEQLGVSISGCGACLNYFELQDEVGVGQIGNMYDILETLSNASKVIYP